MAEPDYIDVLALEADLYVEFEKRVATFKRRFGANYEYRIIPSRCVYKQYPKHTYTWINFQSRKWVLPWPK